MILGRFSLVITVRNLHDILDVEVHVATLWIHQIKKSLNN